VSYSFGEVTVNRSPINPRARNALASGAGSFVVLLVMTLFIGGTQYFVSIVSILAFVFLAICAIAGILGWCVKSSKVGWSLLFGALSALIGGSAVMLRMLYHI